MSVTSLNARGRAVFSQPSHAELARISARANTRSVPLLSAAEAAAATPRPFTVAEKSLIEKAHGYMPAHKLLEVLNERLVADQGPDAVLHTMEQLYTEIGTKSTPAKSPDAQDWGALRKLVATAQEQGTLQRVTAQLIDDFAVVFSLTSAQALKLADVLLSEEGAAQ